MKGDVGKNEAGEGAPVLVRMHAHDLLDDALAESSGGRAVNLQAAMATIGTAGRGVVVVLCDPPEKSLAARLKGRLSGNGADEPRLLDYGVGAQILLDLGVRQMILLSNHRKTIVGLEGYGLTVVDHQPIAVDAALSAARKVSTHG